MAIGTLNAQGLDCQNPQDNWSLNECREIELAKELNDIEEKLEKLYQALESQPEIVKMIKQSQVGWNAYRYNHCNAVSDVEFYVNGCGTMHFGSNLLCQIALAHQRSREIDSDFSETQPLE